MGEMDRTGGQTPAEGTGRRTLISYWRAWCRAFRFFSLTGAFVPTLLGAVLAWRDGPISYSDAALVIIGGCAIQGAVNRSLGRPRCRFCRCSCCAACRGT